MLIHKTPTVDAAPVTHVCTLIPAVHTTACHSTHHIVEIVNEIYPLWAETGPSKLMPRYLTSDLVTAN